MEEGKPLSDMIIGLEHKYSEKVSSNPNGTGTLDESTMVEEEEDPLELLKVKKKRKIEEAFGEGEEQIDDDILHDSHKVEKKTKKKTKKNQEEKPQQYEEPSVYEEIGVPVYDSENDAISSQITEPKDISVSD